MIKRFFLLLNFRLFFITPAVSSPLIPAEMVEITDGDTVILKIENNEFPLRLTGVDCFETSDNTRCYKQAYYNNLSVGEIIKKGNYSKKYLEKLYKNSNKNVSFEFKGLDIYSRVLGILYFDNINVNELLIKEGGCFPYKITPKEKDN